MAAKADRFKVLKADEVPGPGAYEVSQFWSHQWDHPIYTQYLLTSI